MIKVLDALGHIIEGTGVIFLFCILKLLPFTWSSWVGGAIARSIGPHLPISRRGRKNLHHAFPQKTSQEINKIIKGVWENLGRVMGELPHLNAISRDRSRLEIVNENLLDEVQRMSQGGIFISAHLANWELPHSIVTQHHMPISLMARDPNNSITAWFIKAIRGDTLAKILIKGPEGSKESIRVVKNKQYLGLLIDQRYSEGIQIPFFRRLAYTVLGPAKLAHKYNVPLIPVHVERLKGVRFRITFGPILEKKKSPEETMVALNEALEHWITVRPDQWLWLHNRWRI